jgi:murein DD-endopeptidase MepM/ murein hydrolase activator NlpD
MLLVSCAAPPKVPFTHLKYMNGRAVPGAYYAVQRGDTLEKIADEFWLDVNMLARLNERNPREALGAGDRIFIPRLRTDFPDSYYAKPSYADHEAAAGSKTREVASARVQPLPFERYKIAIPPPPWAEQQGGRNPGEVAGAGSSQSRSFPSQTQASTARATRQRGIEIAQSYTKRLFSRSSQRRVPGAPSFQWPTGGTLTSLYNVSSRATRVHLGVDIANKMGSPVRAAYSGKVLYSDRNYLPSMGNMILIEHPGGWITLYAHNAKNLVKENQVVETGQVIALMGNTGKSTGPHLHFEIRKNAETPVDPLDYLPSL